MHIFSYVRAGKSTAVGSVKRRCYIKSDDGKAAFVGTERKRAAIV